MAIHISKNRPRRSRRTNLISDINVTPMVDVMLVLLIIFMITAPMLVTGIEVDLPKTDSSPIAGQDLPLVISINNKGDIFIAEKKILPQDLIPKLTSITKEKKDTRIFVRGDKNLSYGKIVEIMTKVNNAGFTKVALISDIKP